MKLRASRCSPKDLASLEALAKAATGALKPNPLYPSPFSCPAHSALYLLSPPSCFPPTPAPAPPAPEEPAIPALLQALRLVLIDFLKLRIPHALLGRQLPQFFPALDLQLHVLHRGRQQHGLPAPLTSHTRHTLRQPIEALADRLPTFPLRA